MIEAKFLTVDIAGIEPEHDAPSADRLISGDPQFTTWSLEERDGIYAGIWQATPGKWRISYEEWEFVHLLSGSSVITEDGGETYPLKAGDSFLIRPGFKGTWEVLETIRKQYVIKV